MCVVLGACWLKPPKNPEVLCFLVTLDCIFAKKHVTSAHSKTKHQNPFGTYLDDL